jgi:aminopeptidase N
MPSTHKTQTVRLADYASPPYAATRVDMRVRLAAELTKVDVTTRFVSQGDHGGASPPLELDGEELTLESIELDGMPLPPDAYAVTADRLTLLSPPRVAFTLTIRTTINPSANTRLMGLYRSNGIYCTQCEADGFRRISYFQDRPDVMALYRVRLEASRAECPVLLANGNPVEAGDLPDGWHFAVWDDPHPKPCYLFAIVGGDLGTIHDRFTTSEGRNVALAIHVERGKEGQAD